MQVVYNEKFHGQLRYIHIIHGKILAGEILGKPYNKSYWRGNIWQIWQSQ